MAIAILPVLMIIVGILLYALTSKTETKEFGRAMFWAGWIAVAIAYSNHMVHIG